VNSEECTGSCREKSPEYNDGYWKMRESTGYGTGKVTATVVGT